MLVLLFALFIVTQLTKPTAPPAPDSSLTLPNGLSYAGLHMGDIRPGMSLAEVKRANPHQCEVTYHPDQLWVRDIEGFKLYHDSTLLVSKSDSPAAVRAALGEPDDERMHWSKLLGRGFDWFYMNEHLVVTFYGGENSDVPGVWMYKCELIWDRAKEKDPNNNSWKGKSFR